MKLGSLIVLLCVLGLPILAGDDGAEAAPTGSGLRIYSDEIYSPPLAKVTFGYDRNALCTVSPYGACTQDSDCSSSPNDVCGVTVDSLAPGTQTEIWDLVCDPLTPGGTDCQTTSWNFSGNNLTSFPAMVRFASTNTEIDVTETCSHDRCGFSEPGAILGREDRGWDTATNVPTVNAIEFEDRAPEDHTIWLRAAVRNEGVTSGGLGQNESRICYTGTDRTSVALWRFPNCDADGCYMQVGDAWEPEHPLTGDPQAFQCEHTVFNQTCNGNPGQNCGFICALYAYACETFAGKQTGEVIHEGTVTLPSGHTFQALVTRSNAEFCLGLFSSCGNAVERVRTVLYLWEVANLGTVVRLQSRNAADGVLDFNSGPDIISEMDVKYGLFPPLSVSVGSVTDTTVQLSWNPGLITDQIDGYRIYWDTDSGGASSYGSDSESDAGQVVFAGTSATISGLTPGTTYYFTVNSVADFTDPFSGVITTYESTLYPTQIPAVPVDLPLEVLATTSGGSAAGAVPDGDDRPGVQLSLAKAGGGTLTLSWGASCQAGDTNYGIYEGSLGSFAGHVSTTCDTGGSTTSPVVPLAGDRYFVVVPNNASSEGSYGLSSSGVERATSAAACRPQNIGVPVCP